MMKKGRLQLSPIGLGCSRIGSFGNDVPLADVRRMLDRALELGVTVLDTADVYGQGDSEREIGRALKGRRDAAFVVTKVGKRFSRKMRALRLLKPILKPFLGRSQQGRRMVVSNRSSNIGHDFSGDYVVKAAQASLRRLQFETIDALLLHSPPAEALASPELAEALARLKAAGQIRHFGISCDDIEALRAALAIPGVELLELPLDVMDAAGPAGLSAAIAERGIDVLAREVIRLQPGLEPAAAVARAAARADTTCAIVGTTRTRHLEAAVAATVSSLASSPA